jgi:hypothetical protein
MSYIDYLKLTNKDFENNFLPKNYWDDVYNDTNEWQNILNNAISKIIEFQQLIVENVFIGTKYENYNYQIGKVLRILTNVIS